ncbi:MAG: hypothetical protein RLZZ214_374, partial [Verrucomicrobiota bacterium]
MVLPLVTKFRPIPLSLAFLCGFSAHAADLHVSAAGRDSNSGT